MSRARAGDGDGDGDEDDRSQGPPPRTPDGRYLVVRGRLWRCANPALDPAERDTLVAELMALRRAMRGGRGGDAAQRAERRRRLDDVKRRLGERGPVWWDDGAPDHNRRLVANTPYAAWFASLGVGTVSRR